MTPDTSVTERDVVELGPAHLATSPTGIPNSSFSLVRVPKVGLVGTLCFVYILKTRGITSFFQFTVPTDLPLHVLYTYSDIQPHSQLP